MSTPKLLTLNELFNLDLKKCAVWTLSRFVPLVNKKFSFPVFVYPKEPERDLNSLITIGGGTIIDFAKVWKNQNNPQMMHIVIPSIWGSGAENSPVAILNVDGKKVIRKGQEFLPDIRIIWDELAENLPYNLVKYACGDVWAHALEGFLSPIANNELRVELAQLIKKLQIMPIENTPQWFELSAEACDAQARSSVGLVHAIAHNLEGPMRARFPNKYFGHAQLCATCLWPVMRFNLQNSDRVQSLFNEYDIDVGKVINILKYLFEREVFNDLIYVLKEKWSLVIRDPLSRMNCTLVRPHHLSYFIHLFKGNCNEPAFE